MNKIPRKHNKKPFLSPQPLFTVEINFLDALVERSRFNCSCSKTSKLRYILETPKIDNCEETVLEESNCLTQQVKTKR